MAKIGDIPADGNCKTDQGGYFKQLSIGTTLYTHDPVDFNNLPSFFGKPRDYQIPANAKVCSCCGDARPKTYFDPDPEAHDGYYKWCRQCVNSHDPKLAKEKYCSVCKIMHPRADFADDERYADGKFPSCVHGKRRDAAAAYARSKWLEQGVAPGTWGGHRERQAG